MSAIKDRVVIRNWVRAVVEMSNFFKAFRSRMYTLIELIVVLSVISILLTLLTTVLKKAVETTDQINCSDNLRQYGLAFVLYVNDNNQMMPPGWSLVNGSGALWAEHLFPYLGYGELGYSTPAAEYPLACPTWVDHRDDADISFDYSYARNYQILDSRWPAGIAQRYGSAFYNTKKSIKLEKVSETAVIMDAKSEAINYSNDHNVAFWHDDGANVLYYDWHVDLLEDPDWASLSSSYGHPFSGSKVLEWVRFWGRK